jgi:hypothetical protein
LKEEAHGSHSVSLKGGKAKAVYDRRRVSVESALGAVVAKSNEEVEPEAPVGELVNENCQPRAYESCDGVSTLTAFLNASRPIFFFFLPFMGSSS